MNQLTVEALTDVFQRSGVDDFPGKVSVVCAVSGGLDSMVLAHLLVRSGCRVRAIHIDHASNAESANWAQSVTTWMAALGVSTHVHRMEPAPHRQNLEAYWREARYAVFDRNVQAHEVLLTAHHLDDQAETLLLQLMRGAGPTGLQAMPLARRSGNGSLHLRPLLAYARNDLERYAEHHQLNWIDDPSNQDQHYDRNYVRHTVIPALTARWPAAAQAMARSASLIAQSVTLDEERAIEDARFDGALLDWAKLEPLSLSRQANAVRYWLRQLGLRYPNRRRLDEALRQWRSADRDRLPELALETGKIQRYRGFLVYADDVLPVPDGWAGELDVGTWLALPPGLGRVGLFETDEREHDPATEQGSAFSGVHAGDLVSSVRTDAPPRFSVRFRANGERLRRASGQHQSLKHWFQDAGIPPVLRARWPLFFLGDELVVVAGRWVQARYRPIPAAVPGQKNYCLIWRRPPAHEPK